MASTDAEAASLPAPSNHHSEEDDAHTPTPLSPPRSKTPPTITGKRAHSRAQSATATAAAIHRSGSAPVNPSADDTEARKDASQSEDADSEANGAGGVKAAGDDDAEDSLGDSRLSSEA